MCARLRGQKIRCVAVRDADQGEDPVNGVFALPGELSPEQLLLESGNILRGERLVNGLTAAHTRAAAHGLGHSGSEQAKRIFQALCAELGMEAQRVSDRLTLAWLDRDGADEMCNALIGSVKRALDLADPEQSMRL